jgi:hypothetical protein
MLTATLPYRASAMRPFGAVLFLDMVKLASHQRFGRSVALRPAPLSSVMPDHCSCPGDAISAVPGEHVMLRPLDPGGNIPGSLASGAWPEWIAGYHDLP